MRPILPMLLPALMLCIPSLPVAHAAGLEAGKDCHVVLTCNFRRGASVRGCLSSYSCRQCQLVKQGTMIVNGVRETQYGSVCEWGGS